MPWCLTGARMFLNAVPAGAPYIQRAMLWLNSNILGGDCFRWALGSSGSSGQGLRVLAAARESVLREAKTGVVVGGTKRDHPSPGACGDGREEPRAQWSSPNWSWGLVTTGEGVDHGDGYCGGIPACAAIRRCESEVSPHCKCMGCGNTTGSVIIEVVITLITLTGSQISVSIVHTCHFILWVLEPVSSLVFSFDVWKK